jgi:hypothetical protein
MTFTKGEKTFGLIAYAALTILCFFVGIPKLKFGAYVVAFLIWTAFCALAAYLVKRLFIDKKVK